MNYRIENAAAADLDEILRLQKDAFHEVGRLHDDLTIPPLSEAPDEIRRSSESQCILKCVADNRIIGSVRGYVDADGTCRIGRLFVTRSFEGKGIGQALMNEIEKMFPLCREYAIFTGEKSGRAIGMYAKLGYLVTGKEWVGTHFIVHMIKKNNGTQ